MRNAFVFIITFGMLLAAQCARASANGPAAAEGVQLSTDQALSIAEKQHDIIKLLIKEGLFDRVLPEFRKILDLNLTGKYEESVAKSAGYIAYLLAENRQYALAHEVLDETIARMQLAGDAASLLKIKAYIYRSEGKLPKAIQTLERAVELERQR
jgi:tetratricopeptide (TPR) repeat protein